MFTMIRPQIAKHTDGYTVRFTGRFSVEYASDELIVAIEIDPGPPTTGVFPHSMKFFRGGEPTTVSEVLRMAILDRVLKGMQFLGVSPVIEPEPVPTEPQVYQREQLLVDGELIQRSIKPSRFGPGIEDGTNRVQ